MSMQAIFGEWNRLGKLNLLFGAVLIIASVGLGFGAINGCNAGDCAGISEGEAISLAPIFFFGAIGLGTFSLGLVKRVHPLSESWPNDDGASKLLRLNEHELQHRFFGHRAVGAFLGGIIFGSLLVAASATAIATQGTSSGGDELLFMQSIISIILAAVLCIPLYQNAKNANAIDMALRDRYLQHNSI